MKEGGGGWRDDGALHRGREQRSEVTQREKVKEGGGGWRDDGALHRGREQRSEVTQRETGERGRRRVEERREAVGAENGEGMLEEACQ